MNIKDLQNSAREAADLLKALSSENRLLLLCQLADGDKTVGELAGGLLARSRAVHEARAASDHLPVLAELALPAPP